jgi:PAS domain S-box-containing protein
MRFFSGDRQFLQFTLQDITQQRQTQAALREQAALLAASHDAIIVWDKRSGVQYLNPAAEQLTGRSLSDAKSKALSFLLRTRSELALTAAMLEVTTHGKWAAELTLLSSEDKPREVATRWLALKDAQGNPGSVLITCNDITEQKQLQAQYLRAQRLESVGTLASGVAHDLNNILSPILMGVDLLEMVVTDEETRDSVAMMKESARRGSDTVKQLLTFARGADSQKGPVQPRHLLKEITRLIQQTFPKNIQIYSDYTGQPSVVLADPSQLHQVLMNLCVNARDAMSQGGVLFLRLENITLDTCTAHLHPKARPIAYVVFKISDSGTGIPPQILERIFDPFFTTKPQGQGTGLGLSTVLGIVENHDGFVLVESQLNQGTTFQVFLPASANAAEPGAPAELAQDLRGRGEWVLVVDDEPAIVRMAESVLRKAGYQTMSSGNASEAIHLYERNLDRIQAVITDVMMPFGDGRQLIMMLYEQDPNLPVIAMSGLSSPEFQHDLKQRGACTFLSKPFTAEQLLARLAQALKPNCKISP